MFLLTAFDVAGIQTARYFNVAGMAILIYQYVTTFDEEVRWMWGRGWDVTRIVFMVARYLPFVGMGSTIYSALRSSSESCGPPVLGNVVHILSIVASEVLLILRTYAFWQGDKRVLYGLLVYGCLCIAAAIPLSLLPGQIVLSGVVVPKSTCLFATSRNSTFVYLVLLAFELVILFLTVYKRFESYRGVGKTGVVHTLYRDGVFYIFSIFLVTFANVLLGGVFPLQYSDLLELPQVVLHSVLAARIMFNLRKSCARLQGDTGSSEAETLGNIVYEPGSKLRPIRTDMTSEFDTKCGSRACTDEEWGRS